MSEKYLGSAFLMEIAKFAYAAILFFRKLYRKPSFFRFQGREYEYFEHPYNGTWMNERALEIPVAIYQVSLIPPHQVLEVGNVLSHYVDVKHIVVDKYERRPGVISSDIVDVSFDRKFDLVISISTVEHVGWDEIPRYPEKSLLAIEKMRRFLSKNGRLFITIPLGYNTYLDGCLFEGTLNCSQIYFYRRLNKYAWQEADREQVLSSTYGKKYRSTDGLAVCIWRRD